MKVNELIRELGEYEQSSEVVVYSEDNVWPVLAVQLFEGATEIYCGWNPIEEERSE